MKYFMDEQIMKLMKSNFMVIIISICIMSFILVILQIFELIRFHNYGRISINEKVSCKECLWRRKVNSGNNIDISYCIRPRVAHRPIICKGQCKYMKYNNLPPYPKSFIFLFMETILAVLNFLIVAGSFVFNIF